MTTDIGKQTYRTIILSDLHLGSKQSRTKDIIDFLEKYTSQTLILNGDIIDMWALKRGGKWKDIHTKALRKILKVSEKCSHVYWLRGNHDDFIHDFIMTIVRTIRQFKTIETFNFFSFLAYARYIDGSF